MPDIEPPSEGCSACISCDCVRIRGLTPAQQDLIQAQQKQDGTIECRPENKWDPPVAPRIPAKQRWSTGSDR